MPLGAIVGTVELLACVTLSRRGVRGLPAAAIERWRWLEDHEHVEGPMCWILDRPRLFAKPIPYKGEQGLFDVPAEVLAERELYEPWRFCRVCGCDDLHACPEGCHWVEPDLCSQCAGS